MRTVRSVPLNTDAPAALFIRPDGYVAWAGEPDPGALDKVLQTRLGAPMAATHDTRA